MQPRDHCQGLPSRLAAGPGAVCSPAQVHRHPTPDLGSRGEETARPTPGPGWVCRAGMSPGEVAPTVSQQTLFSTKTQLCCRVRSESGPGEKPGPWGPPRVDTVPGPCGTVKQQGCPLAVLEPSGEQAALQRAREYPPCHFSLGLQCCWAVAQSPWTWPVLTVLSPVLPGQPQPLPQGCGGLGSGPSGSPGQSLPVSRSVFCLPCEGHLPQSPGSGWTLGQQTWCFPSAPPHHPTNVVPPGWQRLPGAKLQMFPATKVTPTLYPCPALPRPHQPPCWRRPFKKAHHLSCLSSFPPACPPVLCMILLRTKD